jgi:hypothetical protein
VTYRDCVAGFASNAAFAFFVQAPSFTLMIVGRSALELD